MNKNIVFELSQSRTNSFNYSIDNGHKHCLYYTFIPAKYKSRFLNPVIFIDKYYNINENNIISFNVKYNIDILKRNYKFFNMHKKRQRYMPTIKMINSNNYKKSINMSNKIINLDKKYINKNIFLTNNLFAYVDDVELYINSQDFVYKTSKKTNSNFNNAKTLKKAYDSFKTNILNNISLSKNNCGINQNKILSLDKNNNKYIMLLNNVFINNYSNSLNIINNNVFLNKNKNKFIINKYISLNNNAGKCLNYLLSFIQLNTYYSGINYNNKLSILSKYSNNIYYENFYFNLNKDKTKLSLNNTNITINKQCNKIYCINKSKMFNKNTTEFNINSYNVLLNKAYKKINFILYNPKNLLKVPKKILTINTYITFYPMSRKIFTLNNINVNKKDYDIYFYNIQKRYIKVSKKISLFDTSVYIKNIGRKLSIIDSLHLDKRLDDKIIKHIFYQYDTLFVSKNMQHIQYDYNNKFISKYKHNISYQYNDIFINLYPKSIYNISNNILIDKNNLPIYNILNIDFININSLPISNNKLFLLDKNNIKIDKYIDYNFLMHNSNKVTLYKNTYIRTSNKGINLANNLFINTYNKKINANKNLFINTDNKKVDSHYNIRINNKSKGIYYSKFKTASIDSMPIRKNATFRIDKNIKHVFENYDNLFVDVKHYNPEKPHDKEYELTGKIDELILPHNDFNYDKYLSHLIDKQGNVDLTYVKSFDTKMNRYIVSIPVENPIDTYATIGRQYLDLDTGILECIIKKIKDIWKQNMYKYIAMFATDALKNIIDILFNYINDTFKNKEEHEQAIRCLQLFRWYAEMAVLNNCDYTMYFDSKTAKIDYYNKDLSDLKDIIILNNMTIDDSYLLESKDTTKPCSIIFKNTKRSIIPILKLHIRLYNINGQSSISSIEDNKIISESIYKAGIHELDIDIKDKVIIIFDPTDNNQNMAIANTSIINYPKKSFNVLYKGRFGDINNVMQELLNELKIYNNVTNDVKEKFKNVAPTTLAIDTLIKYFNLHHKNKDKGKRLIIKK